MTSDRTATGMIRVENDVWLCSPHVTEHIHSPDVMEAAEADFDLEKFHWSDGSKPS